MSIIQQCESCSTKGNKNLYCKNCIKFADYFDVYKYADNNDRFNKGKLIGRIKAYTWHDAIEYIKYNLFYDRSKNFNINCEKDFAYIEEKNTESNIIDNKEENLLGYKLYLNKEGYESESSSLNYESLWDLTLAATNNNSTIVSNTPNKEQQTE